MNGEWQGIISVFIRRTGEEFRLLSTSMFYLFLSMLIVDNAKLLGGGGRAASTRCCLILLLPSQSEALCSLIPSWFLSPTI